MKIGQRCASLQREMVVLNAIVLLGPIVTGALLIWATVSKLLHSDRMRDTLVDSYGFTPGRLTASLGYALPALEVFVALALLSGHYPHAVALAAVLLLVAFSAVVFLRLKHGAECGCGVEAMGRSRGAALTRNVLLIALLAPALLIGQAEPFSGGSERLLVVLFVMLILLPLAVPIASLGSAGDAIPRRSFLRLAGAAAVVLLPALLSTQRAEAACYGCRTCSSESVFYGCDGVCCIYLVRDREYCDTGCSPCSAWRQEVYC